MTTFAPSPTELAAMRADVVGTLTPAAVTVSRVTYANDGQGGQTSTVAVAATLAGRWHEVHWSDAEMWHGDQLAGRRVWRLVFAYDADVRAGDILAFGTVTRANVKSVANVGSFTAGTYVVAEETEAVT